MDWMPYLAAVFGFSSTLSLTIFTLPLSAPLASSSSAGAIMRQGPHHSAQKSTTTGLVDCNTSDSNVLSDTLPTVMAFSFCFAMRSLVRPQKYGRAQRASRMPLTRHRGIQDRGGNLHQIRHIGPEERGADVLVRVELAQHGAVKRELTDVGCGYIVENVGCRTVSLVIADEDGIAEYRQPVDLPGNRNQPSLHLQPADDWHLGPAGFAEQLRKFCFLQQATSLLGHALAFFPSELARASAEILSCRISPRP